MPDVTLTLRGDQIGTFGSLSGNGNGVDRVVTLNNVEALGSSSDIYTVLVEQVNDGVTEFQNGQFVTVFDSDGNVVFSRTGINPDAEQGQASGDEHLIVSGQNFLFDLGGVPAGPTTVTYGQADQAATVGEGDDDGNLDFASFAASNPPPPPPPDPNAFPCFTPGTLIATTDGEKAVEALRPGMRVICMNLLPQKIRWIGCRTITLGAENAESRPIRIAAGALGPGLPRRTLRVSPGHRMFLQGPGVRAQTGQRSALGVTRGLTALPGVAHEALGQSVTYYTILLDRHAVIYAEGAPTESFYPGPYAMKIVGAKLREQIAQAIPGFETQGLRAYGPPALPLMSRRQSKLAVLTGIEPLMIAAGQTYAA